nr:M24 family metallopeptidase [bacterium]
RIRAAAEIVDAALTVVRPLLAQQPTERDFARALDASIRSGGADDLGFDTIVASGPNGAIPHHAPGNRTIERGDLVIVDVGAMVHGYRSDMTRTFCVGPMSPEQRHHYDTVLAAQQAGVDAMVAGAGTAQVDAAARTVIADAGWADSFTHGTGHGVGLDIHELPRVAKDVPDVYELGTVATVEPGVYLKGSAGVRIEDTCVVTTSGAERLTGFPKDPEVL